MQEAVGYPTASLTTMEVERAVGNQKAVGERSAPTAQEFYITLRQVGALRQGARTLIRAWLMRLEMMRTA